MRSKPIVLPFQPRGVLKHAHIQTVRGNLIPDDGITYTRQRVTTKNDDFIDLDIPTVNRYEAVAEDKNAPIVLVLHGLGGNAKRGYMCEYYRQLAAAGMRAIGMNYAGASGEINRQPHTYHSGAIANIEQVFHWMVENHPNTTYGIIGVSIGGIRLLNLLGQADVDAQAAVALSPAFSLNLSARRLSNSIYNRYILNKLLEITRDKADQLAPYVDVEKVLASKTIYDFDEFGTAPLNGYANAEDYYTKCSPAQRLQNIRIPTLIIRAKDDPFMDPKDIPYEKLGSNSYITAAITHYGGHVGFCTGTLVQPYHWAHAQTIRFLAHHLQ